MARRKIVSKSKQEKQEEKATVVPIRGRKKKEKEPIVVVSGSATRKPKPLKYLKERLKAEHDENGRSSLYQYWRRTIEKHYGVESVPSWARKKRK